jgi:nicotinamidase-related amidase
VADPTAANSTGNAVKNADLHGNAPDNAPVALLLIDFINAMDFEGGEALLQQTLPVAGAVAKLKRRAKAAGIPVVYVNDNYGKWRSDFQALVDHCADGSPGQPIAELLQPDEDDYFVLKPKHSGFFSTTLDTLLDHLGTRTLVLTGVAGNICVLFTASDAYMRDFHLVIPEDCLASQTEAVNRQALEQMRTVLDADTTPSAELDLRALLRGSAPSGAEAE